MERGGSEPLVTERRAGADRRAGIGGASLAAMLMLVSVQGCILPVPSETLRAVEQKTVRDFVPGTSTRADVLLRLGDPSCRGEQDGHFVYAWEKTHGGLVLGYPLPFAGAFGVSCHDLVIRFQRDGRVADLNQFDGEIQPLIAPGAMDACDCGGDPVLSGRVDEWLATPMPERR